MVVSLSRLEAFELDAMELFRSRNILRLCRIMPLMLGILKAVA